jgi:hypothetical protein
MFMPCFGHMGLTYVIHEDSYKLLRGVGAIHSKSNTSQSQPRNRQLLSNGSIIGDPDVMGNTHTGIQILRGMQVV